MKKLLFLLMLVTGRLLAQNAAVAKHITTQTSVPHKVSGLVKDTTGTVVPGAVIKLKAGVDSMLVATDLNGAFAFLTVKATNFSLTVTSLGYRVYIKKFNNIGKDFVVDPIVLKSAGTSLKAVTVNGKPGTVYKADTVAYRAGNYKVKPNPTLDGLLKQMEGYEVGKDGSVTHQGQAVTKVIVNGKEYRGAGAAQAIQNLPADILEKAQVIDDYGDQAAMTGIKSGNPQKILNITTTADVKDESYKTITEKGFQKPLENPLSTFSVDVDAASYSNIRRFINGGQLPPPDAVRIEEMINYFSYHLPEPKDDKPVAILTELSSAPWNPQHQLLRVSLKAKTVSTEKLPASNLVFLIDVSGSMDEPNKLPLVKSSLKMLVEQLRAQDKVAIVVYAGNAGLVLPATNGDQKNKIDSAIDNLSAGGSTAGGAGLQLAYKIAKANFKPKGNNRIILSTDGDFNVGASSDESMEQLITNERESGVAISIMGFGMGNYKDSKMETMADKGNGNYAYIDNITEAHKALVDEFGGTMFTVAKDVKLQLEFNPAKVQAYRLIGYDDRLLADADFNNDKKDAGDMGTGHNVTAFYEIIPAGLKDEFGADVDELKYQKMDKVVVPSLSNEVLTVKFRYKDPGTDVSKLSEAVVVDKPIAFDKTSTDFKFAASVTEVGMLLRGSEFKQKASFDQAIGIAKTAKDDDAQGYRSEFIRLAESAKLLSKSELAAKE